jgi:hypothetical protein
MKACSLGRPRYLATGAGGDDQRVAGVAAGVARERERALRQVDLVDVVEDDLRVEALGVLQEALHQVGALHAVDVGRPVVDIGGGHQLAALGHAGDQQRLQVGACGIDRGGVAGRAGAEDQHLGMVGAVLMGAVVGIWDQGRPTSRESDAGRVRGAAPCGNKPCMGTIDRIVADRWRSIASRMPSNHKARGPSMSMLSNLDLIRRVPLFSMLTTDQAQAIADAVVKRRFRRGELVVEQGRKSNALFILLNGRARVLTAIRVAARSSSPCWSPVTTSAR